MGVSPGDPGRDERLAALNRLRLRGESEAERRRLEALEAELERDYGCSRRLAVYGTLVPGRSNHYMVKDLVGEWLQGSVRGALRDVGWGAVEGYPALVWEPDAAARVAVHLLISPELPRHWERLDAFEGEGYLRILVPVEVDGGGIEVANLYAVRAFGK